MIRTPLTVAAVAATGLLLVGGGTALAVGAGGPGSPEVPHGPVTVASAQAGPSAGDDPAQLVPPELPAVTDAGSDDTGSDHTGAAAAPAPAAPAGPTVDRARAERIALDAAGGGRVTEIEFERADDDDRDHWEIEVRNGPVEHDLEIDAATGAILDHDTEHDD
ncbi:PepSY domain-containing protein [Pseudonocardia nematodicida]|uniref:PepSY domain-containing protein n=1 Tax=Pseudonocardia nematodicida TaxID=1206997 RepID=A0ABV1K776_9PSEU